MELTITQNGALYFAHHKVSKRRAVFFWPLRTRANKQGPDTEATLTRMQGVLEPQRPSDLG